VVRSIIAKESCDQIKLGIREKITRFVLTKVDQELNKLQELSVNCQQQQHINSPNEIKSLTYMVG
jgi:hypothetical protein